VGLIVTAVTGTNLAVLRFYNQRSAAEQWIKEGKAATRRTRFSFHRFRANEEDQRASDPTCPVLHPAAGRKLTQRLFAQIIRRIERLAWHPT